MEAFSQCRVAHFLSDAQKVTGAGAPNEMLRILQSSDADNFHGIATADEPWFQRRYHSSKMFTRSPADVTPRARQSLGATNYDQAVLHSKETNHSGCSVKR
jgi:hypothetical protein